MKEDLQGNSSLGLGVGSSKHHDVSSVKPEGIMDDDSNAGAGDFSVFSIHFPSSVLLREIECETTGVGNIETTRL